jgi:branched-subunit amino acid transport protein
MYLLLVRFCLRLPLRCTVLIMEKEWLCVKFRTVDSVVCLTTDPYPLPKQLLHINFRYPFFSLRSSSICLHLLSCLPVTSILACIFPSVMCVTRQFLQKIRPIQLAFIHSTICTILFPAWLFVILLHFSHNWTEWSFLSFSCTTLQNFPCVSYLLSKVSKFQLNTKLCPNCTTLPVSSLQWNPISSWKDSCTCWKPPLPWQSCSWFHMYILHHVLLCYPNSEIFHISPIVDV